MTDATDINSTLQNIARALSAQVQSLANASPNATASTSPISYPFNNIGTTAGTTIASTNASRFGIIFHNPGTATIYVYPSNMTAVPTTAAVGGTFVVYPGSTLSFPSTMFANVNGAWSAFSGTGSNQSFTVVEFL